MLVEQLKPFLGSSLRFELVEDAHCSDDAGGWFFDLKTLALGLLGLGALDDSNGEVMFG